MGLPHVVFSTPANPHHQRIGGEAAVRALVNAFYAQMESRTDARRIRSMHPPDLAPVRQVLVDYLVEWMGGPRRYSAARGAPRLGRVHQPFAIGPDDRDAWLACMHAALGQCVADAALRDELMAAFSKVAGHLTRSPSSTPPPAGAPP